ncbi:MAG: protein-glutamate O-methyltransferase [Pseudomonadota bacterium]
MKTRVDALSDANLGCIAEMIKADAGIALSPSKASLVHSRLSKRVRNLQLSGFDEYCEYVQSAAGSAERREMLSALTTNVTSFFRESHHFDELREHVLPPLIASARAGGRVRIWSAGCSTGEEAYSICLTLLSMLPNAHSFDIRILATDIDPNVLATARTASYPTEALARAPADLVEKYFEPDHDKGSPTLCAESALRQLISFKELNLIAPWPFTGPFDVIFCRNVIIYFDADTQAKLMAKFAAVMKPGSRLFLGHSERISSTSANLFRRGGLTTYSRI